MAIQELTLPQIANALIRAKHRGVRVQVVLKTTTAGPGRNSIPAIYQLTAGAGTSNYVCWQTAIATAGSLLRNGCLEMPSHSSSVLASQ